MAELESYLESIDQPYALLGVGIPGSGKSTYLTDLARSLGIQRICPDDIREELSGDASNQLVNAEAWERAYQRANDAIGGGESVIIDATHADHRRMQTTERYRSYGALTVVAAVFEVPLDVAKARNTSRDRIVPEHVLEKMYTNLHDNPVSLAEGFDAIFHM